MILKLADMFSTDNETPRIEAVLILSFLTTLNVVTFFGLISTFIGESILSNNKLYVMLELSPVF
jgi:hypothetical protein